ncbi:MAG: hypothetical protein K2X87_12070 [Gemmataceae bacterium]|nr:hypothetical protein [Gemmataceae bacterium]
MIPAPPWPEAAYRFDLPDPDDIRTAAAEVFRRVWRTTPGEPGFAVVRFAGTVDSRAIRRAMLRLVGASPVRFVPERLGRFDQQVTSRFHRDGAPPASLLVLGYESSSVRGRLFVADAHRAARDAGLGVTAFLARFNPMLPVGEAALRPYTTELAVPHGEPHLVVLNNSLFPDGGDGSRPLGVLHKAEVPEPDPAATRVINSAGLMPAGDPAGTPLPAGAASHFLTRTDLD